MSAGIGIFFAVIGYALGLLTRGAPWALTVVTAALFVVPFLWQFDPRNLIMEVATRVFSFWGGFTAGPHIDTSLPVAFAGLCAYLAVALGIITLSVPWRRLR